MVDTAAVRARAEALLFVGLPPDTQLSDAESLLLREPQASWTLAAQPSGNLGDRMEAARIRTRAEAVLIVGSDAPHMPSGRLVEALKHTRSGQVVVGPTEDGGYDCIGLHEDDTAPFDGIPWSTPEVLPTTRALCRQRGQSLKELSVAYDIDTYDDLQRALRSDAEMKCTRRAAQLDLPHT